MNKFIEFLKLVRIEHSIMLVIAVLIAQIIVLGSFPSLDYNLYLSLIAPFFIGMAAFALNDYLDIESDKINKKLDRPLTKGVFSKEFVIIFCLTAYLIGIIASSFVDSWPIPFVIATGFAFLSLLYNYKLKDIALLGNIYIAFTMAIPFIYGNYIYSSELNFTILILFIVAFFVGLAREIIKTIEDIEGDKKARKSDTLPMKIGIKKSIYLASVFYILFICLTPLPFIYGLNQYLPSLILVLVCDIGFIYLTIRLIKDDSQKFLRKNRNISLILLFIGLIALLLAAI
ncbi:MAG: UbiA family prenyltransferase [Candidatus Micrarchaeia archaeon]|jgi:geranylgeranylglycerol-phosphate geranylgeranyltransferase